MSDTRRSRPASGNQLHILLDRFAETNRQQFEALRGDIQSLSAHLGRTDARVEMFSRDFTREVTHIDQRIERIAESSTREIAHLREALSDLESRTTSAAAEGAASGAVQATMEGAARRLQANAMRILGVLGVPLVGVYLVIKEGPPIVRAVGAFFKMLGELK